MEQPSEGGTAVVGTRQREVSAPRPEAQVPAEPTTKQLMAMALEKGTPESVGILERLVALEERVQANAARKAFFDALASFQAEIPPLTKNRVATVASDRGARFSYNYADLPSIVRAIAPKLMAHGLSYNWNTEQRPDGKIEIACTVRHTAGHSETSRCTLPVGSRAGMSEQQKVSSAMTFGQRLSLCTALGIVTADPDQDGGEPATTGPKISEDQATELADLVKETGRSLEKVLAGLRITTLADLPADRYPAFKTWCEGKIAEKRRDAK